MLPAVFAAGVDTSKLKPTGYVNDFAHALDPAGAQRIEVYCGEVERATGAQIAVVTIDSLEDDPIEDVANNLFRQWGIGKKGSDEGLLLLLAIKDHKQRAEVGFGLEPIITDAFSGTVLRGIRPILQQGNYSGALLAAVQQFGQRIAQAKGVAIGNAPPPSSRDDEPDLPIPGPLLILGGILLLMFIGKIFGGGGRGGWGGGGGGFTGFLTGMFLGNLMGRGGRGGYGGGGGGWGGGGFGGGGGGGGGFGGFGGGDSGGGGASSGW